MTEAEDQEETDRQDEGAFKKLELAADHEERADNLREEAKDDVLEIVLEHLTPQADVSVHISDSSFIVTVLPHQLTDALSSEFDQEITNLREFRFRIGERSSLDDSSRIKSVRQLVDELEYDYDSGAPIDEVVRLAKEEFGISESKVEHEIEKLKQKGEVYEPSVDHLRTT